MLFDLDVVEQHHRGGDCQKQTQRLRHPDGLPQERPVKEIQAVRPQPLDPEPAQAVPQEVEPGVLPIEPAGFGDHEQDQQKPDQIPQALIEKRGMDLDILRGAGPQAHPPGQRGLGAEGLPIDEVGPAADALAQQQAHHRQVRHGAHLDLLVPGVEKCHDGPGNHRAVDG